MGHEPDCGFLGLYGDVGSGPCPLCLPGYGFPEEGRLCSPGMEEDMMLVLSLSSAHTRALLLVCSGKID